MKKILKNLSKKNFYLLTIFFILTFVLVLSLIYQQAVISGYKDFLIQKSPLLINLISKKSMVKAFLKGDNLVVNFYIIDEDKDSVNKLLNDLGVDQAILQGITANLDSSSSGLLKKYLPLEADLKLDDKKIILQSNYLSDSKLSSGIPVKRYELASNSAKLAISEGVGSYDILIQDPSEMLRFARSSEMVHLSDSLNNLFPILSKIVRIDLSLKDNKLSGEIVLR